LRATWAGHSSTILQVEGKTLLIDPVWSPSLWGRIHRITPPGVRWSGLPKVDGVLLSHNHYDHLDLATLRRLPRETAIFVPAGVGAWMRRRGFPETIELDWWQDARLDGLHIELVPAHHWSRRSPWDTNRHLWGGWMVSGARHKAYYAGDTAYGPFFRRIAVRHPGIDLAILPIGAYAPRDYNGRAHVDPEEALQAFHDVGAKAMMPVHWGTFRLSPEPVMEPIERLEAAWGRSGLERSRLWDMAIGESRDLEPAQGAAAGTSAFGSDGDAGQSADGRKAQPAAGVGDVARPDVAIPAIRAPQRLPSRPGVPDA
jgi:L-ascorbate metabolism protein UlaG (beta-lactamase superfamily)